MSKLLQHIKDDNPNIFEDLHIQSIVLCKAEYYATIYFVSKTVYTDSQKALIKSSIERVFPDDYRFEIDFSKVYCDEDIAGQFVREFLESEFASLAAALVDINCNKCAGAASNADFTIKLVLNNTVKEYADSLKAFTALSAALAEKFKLRFSVQAEYQEQKADQENSVAENVFFETETLDAQTDQETDGCRIIEVGDVATLFGKPLGNKACYIEDYVLNSGIDVVLCGKISFFAEKISKKQKTFYTFTLEDFTGKIPCMIFPSAANAAKAAKLQDDTQIIARGAVEPDTYRGSNSFYIKHVSFCELPKDFVKIQKKSLPAPEQYSVVTPQTLEIVTQVDLFGESVKKIVPDQISGKSFVVFDVETTGLHYDLDKITEIGAVKIEDGVIVSSFSSLINPQIQIKPETIKLNGIDNQMVKDSPKIYEVMPDFFKYCEGSILVAHNLDFDINFIKYNAKQQGYYFYNSALDTLSMARERLAGLPNYKLNTLCAHFGIELTDHHRAWHDALATAKLFLELSHLPDKAQTA